MIAVDPKIPFGTAQTAKARLLWILPHDRQLARRRRHDKRPMTTRDAQHLQNVALARWAMRLFGG